MKKLLFLCLLVGWFKVAAQDERRVLNGQEYPIWYSRTKILAKFKVPVTAFSISPENLSNQVTKVVPIPNRAAPDVNIYLAGPFVLSDPLAICEMLNQTGLFDYTQPVDKLKLILE